ncbi:MAG: hypothetical protein J5777_08560 [Clostridiales bacterium]|nr:hypothetical protein [Clostridiales bacterium]
MSLKIRLTAAAMASAMLLTAGCNKKPEETTTAPSESVTATSTEETTTMPSESETKETEETTVEVYTEYGKGAYSNKVNNVILKNEVNLDAAIHTYDGVNGLDSGWHGTHWIDITTWLSDYHSFTISDNYLKCGSPEYRFHEAKTKNGTAITFIPVKELEKKSYDGFDVPDEVPVAFVNIQVTLPDGFKIIIADDGDGEEFDISGSGRGWYMTRSQIAVAEYLLECLEKDASKDPLSDIFEHSTVIKTNTYVV